jgi:hypothetical protein
VFVVGFKVADPTMLFTNPTMDYPSRQVAAGLSILSGNLTPLVASKIA